MKRISREGGIASSFIVQYCLWRWWCLVFPVALDAALLTAAGSRRRTNLTVTTEMWAVLPSVDRKILGNVVYNTDDMVSSFGQENSNNGDPVLIIDSGSCSVFFFQPSETELLETGLTWKKNFPSLSTQWKSYPNGKYSIFRTNFRFCQNGKQLLRCAHCDSVTSLLFVSTWFVCV